MADSSGSSLSKVMTYLFMQERSILHILKKTKHLRRLRKWLKKSMKKIAPRLAPHVPNLDGDFEHKLIVVDLIITQINFLLRIDNPATEHVKKFWKEFWESSDEEEQEVYVSANEEEYVSANEDFPREEEQRNEEDQQTNWELIHSLLKKLVDAVTELKGSQLEDGELEEKLRDLKYLPELVDAAYVTPGELPVRMREANIHERGSFVTARNDVRDKKILWPPMVILVNTKGYQDDNGKWIGMGDAKALEFFSLSRAVGSKSAYGPQGHRGLNILIFDASAVGFMEAELLSKRFELSGIGRESWCRSDRVLISDGKRKVYGYMAKKSDIDIFNKYFIGESKLKAEIRSYQEMVVNPMKQICEDYATLHWYKDFMDRVAKRRAHTEKFVKNLPREVQEDLKRSSKEDDQSREIVWPPMVIILNTELDKFVNGKRLGMGDAEVLKYFEGYQAVRSQQSYGPKGHRGMSALIFRASAVGFMDAKFLSEELEDRIKDQDGFSCPEHRVLRHTSGQRILYGHVAEERDMRIFNKHAQGESKLKFEIRSYQEMVLNPMKQMCQDFDIWKRYMSKVIKGDQHLEESFAAVEIALCPNSHNFKLGPDFQTRYT